jgi:hypothetical protein
MANKPYPAKTPQEPRAVTVRRWCEMHDVSRAHAYALMKRGVVRYFYLGDRRRIVLEPITPEN